MSEVMHPNNTSYNSDDYNQDTNMYTIVHYQDWMENNNSSHYLELYTIMRRGGSWPMFSLQWSTTARLISNSNRKYYNFNYFMELLNEIFISPLDFFSKRIFSIVWDISIVNQQEKWGVSLRFSEICGNKRWRWGRKFPGFVQYLIVV